MTPAEMKAKGYSVERSHHDAASIRVKQNGEFVATLSLVQLRTSIFLGFDWHRHDQWHLRSWEVKALAQEEGLINAQ